MPDSQADSVSDVTVKIALSIYSGSYGGSHIDRVYFIVDGLKLVLIASPGIL